MSPIRSNVFADRPALMGHRGLGSGVVRGKVENTLGSFTAAVGLGLPWVEADVRRLRDDTLVVTHEPAYSDGCLLADADGAEADRRGTVRLGALLNALPNHVGVNFDLKPSMDDCLRPAGRTTAALLAPIAAHEAERRPVMISSFDPAALRLLRRQRPTVPLAWLTWHRFPIEIAVPACAHMDVDVLAVHVGSLTEAGGGPGLDPQALTKVVSLVHRSDRQLLVWCPDPESVRVLLAAGADAVVVDDVPTMLATLKLE